MSLVTYLSNRAAYLQLVMAIFAIFSGVIASISVLANDFYFYWIFSPVYLNFYFLATTFILALTGRSWALSICILLIPLSAGFCQQLNAYFGVDLLVLPNVGLDLVAGFYLGFFIRQLIAGNFKSFSKGAKADFLRGILPWPITIVLLMLTASTLLAISRNLYLSASLTSIKGLVFNLMHFRPIDWRDAYMPISDWIAYSLAIAMIPIVITYLQGSQSKNQMIFRPLIGGLFVAAMLGAVQAFTGLGLSQAAINFRKDQFGFAAIGFQPDLHAFAGHMILGAIGLLAYVQTNISKLERFICLLAIGLSWVGLILSKSRATLLLALMAILLWALFNLWKFQRRRFILFVSLMLLCLIAIFNLLYSYPDRVAGHLGLSWVVELVHEIKSRHMLNWSELGGVLGSRLEIWGAGWRMFWQFPLAGIGQGNFYHLSSINFFSKSQFLILNGGENAHNYFLQTLVETGLVGCIVFLISFIYPFQGIQKKEVLLPAALALGSLFLANFFAHSFLVRENLILGAILLGLLYSYGVKRPLNGPLLQRKMRLHLIDYFLVLCVLAAGVGYFLEIYQSFGKTPFTRGFYCQRKGPLTVDGWTGGVFEAAYPSSVKGVELMLEVPYFKNTPASTELLIELRHYKRYLGYNRAVDSEIKTIHLNQARDFIIVIEFSNKNLVNQYDGVELELRTSNCYSPRNLGDSLDSRLLGVRIKSVRNIY